jgi:hypothetical protein
MKQLYHWKASNIYSAIDCLIFTLSLFAQHLNSRSPKFNSAMIIFKKNVYIFVATPFLNFWRDAEICV